MAESAPRRLAAILAGDVSGYSRLMSADEAATVAALRDSRARIEALVARHRGRLVDFTGDAFLAELPSALDAAQCAVAIQNELAERDAALPEERRMQFRLGLHLGDVVAEEGRLYGDGINVAARLEALALPGGLCVSGTVHEQVRRKLELPFEDLGEREVKNIPDPVRVYRLRLGAEPAAASARWSRGRKVAAALAAAAFALALAVALSWPRPLGLVLDLAGVTSLPERPPLPDKPSIAVLPFENLSGDPEQDYFSDGMTEDLTTDLSQIPELFVIARHSAFTYKGRNFDVKDVGRELGVRYVLEGSVRKAGGRVRINAQLVDAQTGFHLWSERYDRDLADVFAVQSEISRRILEALRIELREAEIARMVGRRTPDLRAYDLVLRGLAAFQELRHASILESRRLFARAQEIDPDYADAHAFLGLSYLLEYANAWSIDALLLERAEAQAERALELDPAVAPAHSLRAGVSLLRGDAAAAVAAAQRAVELAPNLDPPHLYLGLALAAEGQFVSALDALHTALRMNPRAPQYRGMLGVLNQAAGRTDRAIALLEEARADNPDLLIARIPLAAIYEEQGRHERAQEVVKEILRVNPELTAAEAVSVSGGLGSPGDAEDRLRRAGLP